MDAIVIVLLFECSNVYICLFEVKSDLLEICLLDV